MSDKHVIVNNVTSVSATSFRGPLPPPDSLQRYEQICPGLADRIVALAEREAASRQKLEQDNMRIAENDITASRAETRHGQDLAFWLSVIAFISAIVCACLGQPWVAGVIAGTTLVNVVSTILHRDKPEK